MIPALAFLFTWTPLLSGCSSATPPAVQPPSDAAVQNAAQDAERGAAVWAHAETFLFNDPPEGEPVCTVVALHGYNTRPVQLRGLFEQVEHPLQVVVPRGPLAPSRVGWAWFDRRAAVSPEVLAEQVEAQAHRMANGIAHIESADLARPIAGKPVVTGFSQGGMLSFGVAVHHPDAVRASLPLSGFLPVDAIPGGQPDDAAKQLPIVAFHGKLDTIIPLSEAQTTVDHLEARGWSVELKAYDNVSHSVPHGVRDDWRAALAEACPD